MRAAGRPGRLAGPLDVLRPGPGLPSALALVRVALAAFVLVWVFGPFVLRSTVPLWIAFAIAVGLELHFFVRGLGPTGARRPDRGPQDVDRERYGYGEEGEDLLLVREAGRELWIPYAGESEEELEALIAEARERADAPEPPRPPRDGSQRRGPRRAVSRFLAGASVIGALALLVWFVESRTGWDGLDEATRDEAAARFSSEASVIAGKPVTIRCDESGEVVGAVQDADGMALVGGDLAYLTPQRCFDLYRLAFKGEVSSSRTARALAVLAHEAWHLQGVRDEGTTECYALQSGVDLGQRLGLTPGTAARMMRGQLAENLGLGTARGAYLVPSGCRDGGSFDLDPESASFP